MKGILIGAMACLLLAGLGYGLIQLACRPSLPRLQRQAEAQDTALARDTAQVGLDTLATDSTGTDSTVSRPAAKRERKSWKRALGTSQAQVKNRDQQIRALTPRLRLFAELHYEVPRGPLLEGALSAEAGAVLRLEGNLDAELSVEQPLIGEDETTLNLAVRKYWRLF